MDYRIINKDTYYRKGVFRHFSEDCKCSVSMTARVDVTELAEYSKRSPPLALCTTTLLTQGSFKQAL